VQDILEELTEVSEL